MDHANHVNHIAGSPEYLLAFSTGFLLSLHCIGMCGGLVSAFFVKIGKRGGIIPYINYHAGRIGVYVLIGAILAVVGSAWGKTSTFRSVQFALYFLASAVVILIGLSMLGLFRLPIEKIPVGPVKKLYHGATKRGPYTGSLMTGALNGFIPCAPLYAMFLTASTSGAAAQGALLMALFGLGTLPAMLCVSVLMKNIGARTRGILYKTAAVMVIIIGLMTAYNTIANMTGLPVIHFP